MADCSYVRPCSVPNSRKAIPPAAGDCVVDIEEPVDIVDELSLNLAASDLIRERETGIQGPNVNQKSVFGGPLLFFSGGLPKFLSQDISFLCCVC